MLAGGMTFKKSLIDVSDSTVQIWDNYKYLKGLTNMMNVCRIINTQFSSVQFSSVQFSHSVVSDSLRPHESQHARPPCPSPTPGVHSDSMSIESVMPSSHLILCHPLLLLPPIPPSIRVFSNRHSIYSSVIITVIH